MSLKEVLIIGPAYPYRGGPARFNENLCRAFMQQGIDAGIVSFTLQYPSFLFPGSSQFEENASSLHPSIKIVQLINTLNPLSWFKTARYINRTKPDIIIFRYWLPFFAPAYGTISRLVHQNIKKIALTDNVIPHEKRPGDDWMNKYFINSCDGFITMSEKVLKDLNTINSSQHKVIIPHPLYENYPPAVSKQEARMHLQLPTDEKILLFFGLIRPYKGLDILLQAMNDDAIKKSSIKLLIAGEFYDDKDKYLKMINEWHLQDKIILKDYFIPDNEIHYYFCASDAVIQPYKSATNSGVSMVSYFYDKPIISTNVGGLSEIIKDNQTGWLCNPNAKSIAETISKFLNISDLNIFENNIKAYKKTFSWENFIKEINQLYNRMKNE